MSIYGDNIFSLNESAYPDNIIDAADKCRNAISEYIKEDKYLSINKNNNQYIKTNGYFSDSYIIGLVIDKMPINTTSSIEADKRKKDILKNLKRLLKDVSEYKDTFQNIIENYSVNGSKREYSLVIKKNILKKG